MVGKIILICGESGSGKSVIAKTLEDVLGMKCLQSYTTRPKRKENETGHTFVTEDEFNKIKIKDIVAYTVFNGYKYCATKQQVEENDVYIVDKEGIETFRRKYNGNKRPVVFYIKVDEELRKERMLKRGDTEENVIKRLENDRIAFENIENYADFVLDNNDDNYDNVLTLARKIWNFYLK